MKISRGKNFGNVIFQKRNSQNESIQLSGRSIGLDLLKQKQNNNMKNKINAK